jgi:hypothetical protein
MAAVLGGRKFLMCGYLTYDVRCEFQQDRPLSTGLGWLTAHNTLQLLHRAVKPRTSSSHPHHLHPSTHPNMVSTRGHPKAFPEPDLTPSKLSTPSRSRRSKWAHTPANLVLIWLAVSLPLVAWDTGYVMLRPHTMPGGSLQWPLWTPYELYGKMDYVYGWKAYNEHSGFTAAQSLLNIVESAMYLYYLYLVFAYGRQATAHGRGAKSSSEGLLAQRYVDGKTGALAILLVFTAAVMTLSKTTLYCRIAPGDVVCIANDI